MSLNTPTLSVHLLTFNSEKHIKTTLDSILSQKTNFDFEIVIGDDNSKDTTNAILEQYANTHPKRINYKRNPEQLGILKNFKTTLDRCKGTYIFDIAGDDYLKHEYALQKMVDCIQKNDALGFIDSGYDILYDHSGTIKSYVNKAYIRSSKALYKAQLLQGKIYPVGVCYNRKHLLQHVDFNTYIEMGLTIEDYPILMDLVMHTEFDCVDESLHVYRVHVDSFSHKNKFDAQLKLKQQMLNLVRYFSKKYQLPPTEVSNYEMTYKNETLHLSGAYGEKALGKKMYLELKGHRNILSHVHYLSSQFYIFRKFISIFRTLK